MKHEGQCLLAFPNFKKRFGNVTCSTVFLMNFEVKSGQTVSCMFDIRVFSITHAHPHHPSCCSVTWTLLMSCLNLWVYVYSRIKYNDLTKC